MDAWDREALQRRLQRRLEAYRFGILAMVFVLIATLNVYSSLVQLSVLNKVYEDTSLSLTMHGLNMDARRQGANVQCRGAFACAADMCQLWSEPGIKAIWAQPSGYVKLDTCNMSHVSWSMGGVLQTSNYRNAMIACVVVMVLLALVLIGYVVLCSCGTTRRRHRVSSTAVFLLVSTQLLISVLLVVVQIFFFNVQDRFLQALPTVFITSHVLINVIAVMMAIVLNTIAQCYVCGASC